MRLSRAVNLYLDARRIELAKSYRRSLGYTLDRWVRALGDDFALRALKRKHIEDWINTYRTAARAGIVLSAIRGFCEWCVVSGYLTRDPCLGLKGPKRPRLAPRELTHEEVQAVFDACPDPRAELIWSLICNEGLRRGEVARLEIADIDRLFASIHVIGKGGHERFVPLSPATDHYLTRYLGECPAASGPLIRSQQFPTRGLHPDTISIKVSRWCKDAGIKERPSTELRARRGMKKDRPGGTVRSG